MYSVKAIQQKMVCLQASAFHAYTHKQTVRYISPLVMTCEGIDNEWGKT